jgi:hypothetical protein
MEYSPPQKENTYELKKLNACAEERNVVVPEMSLSQK